MTYQIPTPNFTSIKNKTHPLEYQWKRYRFDFNINDLDLLFTMLNGLYFIAEQNIKDMNLVNGNHEMIVAAEGLKKLIENIDDQLSYESEVKNNNGS